MNIKDPNLKRTESIKTEKSIRVPDQLQQPGRPPTDDPFFRLFAILAQLNEKKGG